MKKLLLFVPFIISSLSIKPLENELYSNVNFKSSPSYSSLTKNINLNNVQEEDVRNYYSALNSLSSEERKGENLLKNLKPILRNNFKYISYENVWKAYEITDRDWSKSPADTTTYGQYDATSNYILNYEYSSNSTLKNNPYIHCYYRDDSILGSEVKAFGDHTANGINREHVWPQSHGFKETGNGASGPAGTDLHHLVAADGYVNQSIHNNYPYGYVDKTDSNSTYGNKEYNKNNYKGIAKNQSSNDVQKIVFEPQDKDKGDIARACFYMVAMYNNLSNESGAISEFDPNLMLVSYITSGDKSETSSDTEVAVYGNLKDLLEWNRLDPVDEYEIYRNDLIFNNYQNNRNPFIDFPSWADIIWGDNIDNKYADPINDELKENGPKVPPCNPPEIDNKTLDIKTEYIILIAGVLLVFIIVFIIVYSKASKKKKKKMKNALTKEVNSFIKESSSSGKTKKTTKTKTTSSSKKKSTSSNGKKSNKSSTKNKSNTSSKNKK